MVVRGGGADRIMGGTVERWGQSCPKDTMDTAVQAAVAKTKATAAAETGERTNQPNEVRRR